MMSFQYRFETHGERLYGVARNWMTVDLPRAGLERWTERAGMSEDWIEYFEQLAAVALTGRIVAAGRSYLEQYSVDMGLYRREFRSYLNSYLAISKRDLDDLLQAALPAVAVAEGKISDGLRKERRGWAAVSHPYCYLCNISLDFEDKSAKNYCTLEHLWPSSYGGDSISTNLLPACAICNRARKANFATWATTSVQSVVRGLNPDTTQLNFVTGPTQFALHHLAGQRYAIANKTNLQSAFLRIGPWGVPRVVDRGDVAHFFNLQITPSV